MYLPRLWLQIMPKNSFIIIEWMNDCRRKGNDSLHLAQRTTEQQGRWLGRSRYLVQGQESEFHPMTPHGARANSWELSDLTSTRKLQHSIQQWEKKMGYNKGPVYQKDRPWRNSSSLPNKCWQRQEWNDRERRKAFGEQLPIFTI